jgi:site-specific recombinase XerD
MNDVDRFLSDLQLARRSPDTIRLYRATLGRFVKFTGKTVAKDFTEEDVRCFLSEGLQGLSSNTYFMHIARLKAFMVRFNPLVYVWMKNNMRVKWTLTETEPFSRQQLFALASEFRRSSLLRDRSGRMADLWEAVHWFISALGCRIGETCALNVGDVSLVEADFKIVFPAATTKLKRMREVYLPRAGYAGAMLHNYLAKYRATAVADAPLFVNRDGHRLQRYRVEEKYRNARKKLGIKTRCTPHVLRHTYCTFMVVEKGVDIPTVAELTGHSKEMLLKVYSHVSPKRKRDVAQKYQIV